MSDKSDKSDNSDKEQLDPGGPDAGTTEPPAGHDLDRNTGEEFDRAASYAGSARWVGQSPITPTSSPGQAGNAGTDHVSLGLRSLGGLDEPVRTGGMLAGSILLWGTGGMSILAYLAVAVFATPSAVLSIIGGMGVVDVVIGIGLFRGNQTFRIWALLRAAGTAIAFGVIIPLTRPAETSWVITSFQVAFAVGLVVLLFGDRQSGLRIAGGVGIVLLSVFGVVAVGIVQVVNAARLPRSPIQPYILPGRTFVDDKNTVTVALPEGWVLLSPYSPLVANAHAQGGMYHPQTGSYAFVRIAPVLEDVSSPDAFMDSILHSLQRTGRQVEETGREPATLGGIEGIRAYTRQGGGLFAFSGYYTVCDDLFNHYAVSGLCADFLRSSALRAYEELVAGFRITKSVDSRIAERADRLTEVMPYLSAESSHQLALYLAKAHTSEPYWQVGGLKAIYRFVGLLSTGDQARFKALSQQAAGLLSAPDRVRLEEDRTDLYNNALTENGIQDYGSLASKAFNRLPATAKSQLSSLADRAIEGGAHSQSSDN